jgi:hypothetical protein
LSKEKQNTKTGSLGTQMISCIKRLKVDYKDIKSKTMSGARSGEQTKEKKVRRDKLLCGEKKGEVKLL